MTSWLIAFPTETKAEEVRQKLLAMQKEYLLAPTMRGRMSARKNHQGRIKLNQMISITTTVRFPAPSGVHSLA